MFPKTALGVAAAAAGITIVGYCVYFDHKRRNDPLFKQKLRERKLTCRRRLCFRNFQTFHCQFVPVAGRFASWSFRIIVIWKEFLVFTDLYPSVIQLSHFSARTESVNDENLVLSPSQGRGNGTGDTVILIGVCRHMPTKNSFPKTNKSKTRLKKGFLHCINISYLFVVVTMVTILSSSSMKQLPASGECPVPSLKRRQKCRGSPKWPLLVSLQAWGASARPLHRHFTTNGNAEGLGCKIAVK